MSIRINLNIDNFSTSGSCYAVLCCAMLCYAVICCVMLWYAVIYKINKDLRCGAGSHRKSLLILYIRRTHTTDSDEIAPKIPKNLKSISLYTWNLVHLKSCTPEILYIWNLVHLKSCTPDSRAQQSTAYHSIAQHSTAYHSITQHSTT